MLSVLAKIQIKPGVAAAFEADFRIWTESVKACEPGTLQYTLTRSRDDAQTYYVFEVYADDAALQTHMKNLSARPAGADFFAATPQIKLLDLV